ncbi:MAG: TIGR03619 family F420-dependent LLM class oxidoreductase [Gammaproteobacteria bacterium]|nr:TIGR03619 family F420-dependent LLM class oxidoreductase [Gammaproteobacteria bacterium]
MRVGVSLPVRELGNDMGAIREFAQAADEIGYAHLRVPDQVLRPGSGALHEPMMLLAWVAGVTERIELVPSVIVTPARQTVLLAKQVAELDVLTGGRVRLGVGVGGSADEYAALNQDFGTRGARVEEQLELMRALWTQEQVDFEGRFDTVRGAGLSPLPVQRPIPVWIGARGVPAARIRRRIGRQANGWFVLCSPEEFPGIKADIDAAARDAGRDPAEIGVEAGVAVVGPRAPEWKDRVRGWRETGLTHLCLRTLGGGIAPGEHLGKMQEAWRELGEAAGR